MDNRLSHMIKLRVVAHFFEQVETSRHYGFAS